MSQDEIRVSRDWLALREPADADARDAGLAAHLARNPPASGRWVVHDLACGSGSMGRWLAPRLPGPQHWVLHDRDADLLEAAAADLPVAAADGAPVTAEVRRSDITRLTPGDLAGASLITASALLDMLTGDEVMRLVAAVGGVGCPVLLALSVTGRVELDPADPKDAPLAAAFNDHQRRPTPRGPLLGPDAVEAAAAGFRELGAEVIVRSSPWRLGATRAALTAEWFGGWVRAACEQRPELAADAEGYARRRRAMVDAGMLTAIVDHADLLVLPAEAAS